MLAKADERILAAALQIEVADTMGAGGAFNAGSLHRWLKAEDLSACLDAAGDTGSHALQPPIAIGGLICKIAQPRFFSCRHATFAAVSMARRLKVNGGHHMP
jgi:hypothetical protein